MISCRRTALALALAIAVASLAHAQSDPLPSWNNGANKRAIVGTTFVTKSQMNGTGVPVLLNEPKVDFTDDGPGKPVGIQKFIGRRPIMAFGNSDGDQQMLEWTAAGTTARFIGLVRHTDANREWPMTAIQVSAASIARWTKQSRASGSSWI